MKKAVKGLAGPTSFLLVFAGLIICMFDTVNLDKQLITLCIGIGMIGVGTVVCILMNWGDEDELPE